MCANVVHRAVCRSPNRVYDEHEVMELAAAKAAGRNYDTGYRDERLLWQLQYHEQLKVGEAVVQLHCSQMPTSPLLLHADNHCYGAVPV